jgi:hypothetical protein
LFVINVQSWHRQKAQNSLEKNLAELEPMGDCVIELFSQFLRIRSQSGKELIQRRYLQKM